MCVLNEGVTAPRASQVSFMFIFNIETLNMSVWFANFAIILTQSAPAVCF